MVILQIITASLECEKRSANVTKATKPRKPHGRLVIRKIRSPIRTREWSAEVSGKDESRELEALQTRYIAYTSATQDHYVHGD
jgi:hypothetical protein